MLHYVCVVSCDIRFCGLGCFVVCCVMVRCVLICYIALCCVVSLFLCLWLLACLHVNTYLHVRMHVWMYGCSGVLGGNAAECAVIAFTCE